jgi:hypothetical protein
MAIRIGVDAVVSVGERNGQGLRVRPPQSATPIGRPVDKATPDANHEGADSEKEAAGAEGDVKRHDFVPR